MSTRYLTCADTAKLLRAALKSAHPGVRFSVRSSTYAGGASINVRWTDGPLAADVDRTAQRFAGATFDGMTDLKSYAAPTLLAAPGELPEPVSFGADFVFTDRDISDNWVRAHLDSPQQNGRAGHALQCGQCGDWMPADSDCWRVEATGTVRDFCCSQVCGARLLAGALAASL